MAASKLEDDIWMGDWSFWTIVKGLNAGTHPLLTLDVQPSEGRLPDGTMRDHGDAAGASSRAAPITSPLMLLRGGSGGLG